MAATRAKRAASSAVLPFVPAEQPELPEGIKWPDRTREWWALWADSPLSAAFGVTDWDFLLDTAVLHAAFWSGDFKLAAELRLRVAKFGATPEDRARLRIQFAEADERDAARRPAPSARERYGSVTRAEFGRPAAADPENDDEPAPVEDTE